MTSEIRIVIVEDLETDAQLAVRELKRSGLEISAVRVETEADLRGQIAKRPPDLVLSDFSMPHFDGLRALAIARKEAPDVPFIFVSGTMGEENAIRALKAGATDYVLKNNLVRLPSAIERALREAKEKAGALRRELEDKRLRNLVAGIVDLMTTPLVVTTIEGMVQIVNPAFSRAFGLAMTDVVGHDVRQLAPPEDAGLFQGMVRSEGLLEPHLKFDCRFGKKDGTTVAVRVSAKTIVVDGEPTARIAFIEGAGHPAGAADARLPVAKPFFEKTVAALAERAARSIGVVAGRVELFGMKEYAAKYGSAWPTKRRRIMDAALSIVGRSLGPRDVVMEEDDTLIIAFQDLTESEAELVCRAIEKQIGEFMLGEIVSGPAGGAGDASVGTAGAGIRLATISPGDIKKWGSFGHALDERVGVPLRITPPPQGPSLELEVQKRRERFGAECSEAIAKAKICLFEIAGPKGPAPDVDCLDYDEATVGFLMDNLELLEAEEALKIDCNLARIEAAIRVLIAEKAALGRRHHLVYLSIDVLRDQTARRRFLSLWKLIPPDLQKRSILCFQDINRLLAPIAIESAILQVSGLVSATGISIAEPFVPDLNLQLVKNRVVVVDHLRWSAMGLPPNDNQWLGVVKTFRQKGCKIFLRTRSDAASRLMAWRIGADGVIGDAIKLD